MRIFLDSNILFSATDSRSKTSKVLEELLVFGHEIVTNTYAWKEVRRNVTAKRPHLLKGLEELKNRVATIDAEMESYLTVECEPKDVKILEGAIASGCSHLWTGDKKHFGAMYGKMVHGVLIVERVPLE